MIDEIDRNGYAIRKSLDYIDPRVVKYLFKVAKNKNTKRRRWIGPKRYVMDRIELKSKYMKSFHRKYKNSIKNLKIVPLVGLLYSEENCPRQEIHRDLDHNQVPNHRNPLITCILAVMDNTKIMVRRKKVNLKAGEMVFFRPTTLHCGLEYKEENVRLIQWSYKY